MEGNPNDTHQNFKIFLVMKRSSRPSLLLLMAGPIVCIKSLGIEYYMYYFYNVENNYILQVLYLLLVFPVSCTYIRMYVVITVVETDWTIDCNTYTIIG